MQKPNDAQDKQTRSEILDDLIGIITSSLAYRSTEELQTLLEALRLGQAAAPQAVKAPNDAALVHVSPLATKEDAIAGVLSVAEWLEQHWESLRGPEETTPVPEVPQDADALLPN